MHPVDSFGKGVHMIRTYHVHIDRKMKVLYKKAVFTQSKFKKNSKTGKKLL